MGRQTRFAFALLLLACAFFLTGCVEKTIKPAVILQVNEVEPYQVIPTGTGTATLPTVNVNLTLLSGVPYTIVSYSVAYQTAQGEALPQLRIEETPVEKAVLFPTVPTTTSVVIPVYSSRVVDLYSLTDSDIAPIKATIRLTIHDANDNTTMKEAHCLLYPAGAG